MKTFINNLRFGALLTGFLFLSSCTGEETGQSKVMDYTIDNAIISVAEKTSEFEGKNIPVYNGNIRTLKCEPVEVLKKDRVHSDPIGAAWPISFGTVEAVLVSAE